jgi:hypothetical protein
MKIAEVSRRVSLYETLDHSARRTYKLWESAGYVLKEFALDDAQIKQLFSQIEKDLSVDGGNRTALGKGIDATTAAGKAIKTAYDELVGQVQNSAPMQNADAEYDKLAAQLKAATGGDEGVMKYVQKYRDFATKHPVAQSFIYAALIAAAGISGAGLGGAAVLGLLKMSDRLLQGDKFSSALGKGAMTGATALAAGQIGQAVQGADAALPSTPVAPDTSAIDAVADTAVDAGAEGAKSAAGTAATNRVAGAASDVSDTAVSAAQEIVKGSGAEMFPGLATDQMANNAIKQIADKIAAGAMTDSDLTFLDSTKQFVAAQINDQGYQTAPKELWDHYNVLDAMVRKAVEIPKMKESINPYINYVTTQAAWQLNESLGRPRGGVYLTEAGIRQALSTAAGNISSGIKTAAGNLTTKVTADKLQKAWAKSGNPPDSVALEKFLQQQGVDAGTVAKSMQSIGLQATGATADQKVEPTMSGNIPAPKATPGKVEPTLGEPTPEPVATPEPAAEPVAAAKTPEEIRKEKQAAAAADAQAQMKANPAPAASAATTPDFSGGQQQVTPAGTVAPPLPNPGKKMAEIAATMSPEEKAALVAKIQAAIAQKKAAATQPVAESFRRLNKIIK